jgi:hypothetical protein
MSRVRTAVRVLGLLLAVAVTAGAALSAARLVLPADDPDPVRRQLAFLRAALDDGAAGDAQRMFPEGWFFAHVLYGLTQVDLGRDEPPAGRADEIREAAWGLARLDTEAGRAPFDPGLTPAYGVFHRGWTNWLRGGLLSLQADRDPAQVRRFEQDSAELAAAFDAAPTPFLEAYPGQAWPVDSTVAIASLRLHDRLTTPAYDATVIRWLAQARARLDPGTGLLPHRADPLDGAPLEVPRGTSQSMINRFLVDVDPEFARDQYLRFRTLFVTTPLGLAPGVREYPAGTDGPGDVDSGPLVLGVSLSATAVTLGAARVHGDDRLAGALANTGDVAGVPLDTPWTRRYALGVLPIGDAFVAWSKTARPWVADPPAPPEPDRSRWWRLPLLAVLLLAAAAPWVIRRSVRAGRDQPGAGPGEPDGQRAG